MGEPFLQHLLGEDLGGEVPTAMVLQNQLAIISLSTILSLSSPVLLGCVLVYKNKTISRLIASRTV